MTIVRIVGEFNCSCVGISRCLAAYCKDDTPNACWDDISEEDKAEVRGDWDGVFSSFLLGDQKAHGPCRGKEFMG